MNLKFLNNPGFQKGLGIAAAIFAGLGAISSTLSDQKKEREFEELKKTASELQKK